MRPTDEPVAYAAAAEIVAVWALVAWAPTMPEEVAAAAATVLIGGLAWLVRAYVTPWRPRSPSVRPAARDQRTTDATDRDA